MAALTKQEIKEGGLNATYASADVAGDEFVNTGQEFLHVKNDSASSITVTIPAQQTDASDPEWGVLTKKDITVTVAASSEAFIGKIPKRPFNVSKKATINYSAVTSVTVAVLELK